MVNLRLSIGVCLLLFLAPAWSAAGEGGRLYLSADLLQTSVSDHSVSPAWISEHLPARAGRPGVRQAAAGLTWDVGAGYRFPGEQSQSWWARGWSIEGGYREIGAGVVRGALPVSGHYLGNLTSGFKGGAPNTTEYELAEELRGAYVRLDKGFVLGLGLEPYLSAGVTVLAYDLTIAERVPGGLRSSAQVSSVLVGPTLGGGLKYELYQGIKLRVGAESQWIVSGSDVPAPHWVIVGGGLEVPLTGWGS